MTSTNVITHLYKDNTDAPVSLVEYYIEVVDDKKYIAFKFNNNLNQELHTITLSVDLYDSKNELRERTNFKVNKTFKPYESLILDQKLLVIRDCESIKITVVQAEFEFSVYTMGKFKQVERVGTLDNKESSKNLELSYEQIVKQKELEKKNLKVLKKANKANHSANKQKAKSKGKSRFNVLSLTRSKLKFGLRFLLFIIFASSIAGLIYSSILFKDLYGEFVTIDNTSYEILSSKAYVYKGDKKALSVEIPESITYKDSSYEVVGIKDNAYKNASVETLTLNSNVALYSSAFEGSNLKTIINSDYITKVSTKTFKNTSLTSIELNNVKTVYDSTFANNTYLRYVYLKNAQIKSNAFKGCNNIKYLDIKSTENLTFADIFGSNTTVSINTLYIRSSISNKYTFRDISKINQLYIYSSSTYEKEDNITYLNYIN